MCVFYKHKLNNLFFGILMQRYKLVSDEATVKDVNGQMLNNINIFYLMGNLYLKLLPSSNIIIF